MAEYSAYEMEQRSIKYLNEVVSDYKIFIDTCSLLSEFAESFWEHIIPILRQKKTSIIVNVIKLIKDRPPRERG